MQQEGGEGGRAGGQGGRLMWRAGLAGLHWVAAKIRPQAAQHHSHPASPPASPIPAPTSPTLGQLTDQHIAQLPIPRLQQNGLLFVWVINAKYQFCLDLFDQWGYE